MNTPASKSPPYDTPSAQADGGALVRSWLPAPPARVPGVGYGDGSIEEAPEAAGRDHTGEATS